MGKRFPFFERADNSLLTSTQLKLFVPSSRYLSRLRLLLFHFRRRLIRIPTLLFRRRSPFPCCIVVIMSTALTRLVMRMPLCLLPLALALAAHSCPSVIVAAGVAT